MMKNLAGVVIFGHETTSGQISTPNVSKVTQWESLSMILIIIWKWNHDFQAALVSKTAADALKDFITKYESGAIFIHHCVDTTELLPKAELTLYDFPAQAKTNRGKMERLYCQAD